jgi:type I restriction enzyme S subunit
VDFEFPNEDGEPYKSSGGEMVESELGMIPKGWEVKPLYDVANYTNGSAFKSKDYSSTGLPIIKIAELKSGITDTTGFTDKEMAEKYYIGSGDILFSWSGNPKTSIDVFIWHRGRAILNQHIFKVEPYKDNEIPYVYNLLRSFKSEFERIASNKQTTGLGHVTVKDLKQLKVAVPEKTIMEKYHDFSSAIFKKFMKGLEESLRIEETRDTLLPKLMSGEIRVPLDNGELRVDN